MIGTVHYAGQRHGAQRAAFINEICVSRRRCFFEIRKRQGCTETVQAMQTQPVRVCVRARPLAADEQSCLEVQGGAVTVHAQLNAGECARAVGAVRRTCTHGIHGGCIGARTDVCGAAGGALAFLCVLVPFRIFALSMMSCVAAAAAPSAGEAAGGRRARCRAREFERVTLFVWVFGRAQHFSL